MIQKAYTQSEALMNPNLFFFVGRKLLVGQKVHKNGYKVVACLLFASIKLRLAKEEFIVSFLW